MQLSILLSVRDSAGSWTISSGDGVLFDISNKHCLSPLLSRYTDQQKLGELSVNTDPHQRDSSISLDSDDRQLKHTICLTH